MADRIASAAPRRMAGSWPVMVTPFAASGRIDLGAYRAMIAWYLGHGVGGRRCVGGLYAVCLSSEMYDLDDDERVLLAAEAVRAVHGAVPVVATGNLGPHLDAHLRLCRRMADAGVDAVMLVVPPWLEDDAALERYYLAMAARLDAPLGLYECPVPRPYHLGVPLVRTLARTGRFVAYKETSCQIARIRALAEATRDTPLALLQANVPYLIAATRAGAPGSMNLASIIVPELVDEVIRLAASPAPEDARRVEARHALLCAIHMAQNLVHPQGSKALLAARGVPLTARSRQPSSPLTEERLVLLRYAARCWYTEDGALR